MPLAYQVLGFGPFDPVFVPGLISNLRCAMSTAHEVNSALGLHVRSGIHTGEVELKGQDTAGIAGLDEVIASRMGRDLVAGSGLQFRESGQHAVKGIDEDLQLFAVAA